MFLIAEYLFYLFFHRRKQMLKEHYSFILGEEMTTLNCTLNIYCFVCSHQHEVLSAFFLPTAYEGRWPIHSLRLYLLTNSLLIIGELARVHRNLKTNFCLGRHLMSVNLWWNRLVQKLSMIAVMCFTVFMNFLYAFIGNRLVTLFFGPERFKKLISDPGQKRLCSTGLDIWPYAAFGFNCLLLSGVPLVFVLHSYCCSAVDLHIRPMASW